MARATNWRGEIVRFKDMDWRKFVRDRTKPGESWKPRRKSLVDWIRDGGDSNDGDDDFGRDDFRSDGNDGGDAGGGD